MLFPHLVSRCWRVWPVNRKGDGMISRVKGWLAAVLLLACAHAGAASLADIQVSNGDRQARITFSFMGDPEYAFSQQDKRSVALDIKQTGIIQGLPLQFSGNNLVKSIRAGTAKDNQSIRLVVDLTQNGKTRAVKQQNGAGYKVVFTIDADVPPPPVVAKRETPVVTPRPTQPGRNPFKSDNDRITSVTSSNTVTRPAVQSRTVSGDKVVIAIDAGHGGRILGQLVPAAQRRKTSPSPSPVNCVRY